ncbi:unnamed protein product [Lymnaea stagnalis]|uniref:Uncharacterized protein n=1 Tax=Lymnaea stagnalis TaxID=6523 RepID=A0AAV2I217_LYMST
MFTARETATSILYCAVNHYCYRSILNHPLSQQYPDKLLVIHGTFRKNEMVLLIKNVSLQMFFVFVCCRCDETSNGSLSVCEEYNIITLEASLQETFTYGICIKARAHAPQVNLVTDTRKGYLVGNSTKYALRYARDPKELGQDRLTLEITNMTVNDFVKYKIVSVVGGKEDVIFRINLVHSGCPERWCSVEQGRCLLVIKKNASCAEARSICGSNNGTLYDGTFSYRSRHCSRMKDLKALGGTECSEGNNGSETNKYRGSTENRAHVSHFACFRDLPFPATPTYDNNHVFRDIKYLWIGVGLMFLSLMTFQIVAHRRLRWNRAADGLANKGRIRGKLESIFYWDSSLVSRREISHAAAGANDSIELIDWKDHSEVVEEVQSCEQDTYEIISHGSKASFDDACLRTNDGTGRGNHVSNMPFESGIYAVISERFTSQRSLDVLISDTRERDVPVRAQSAETVDCRNPDVQIDALRLKTMNTLDVLCIEPPLIDPGARIKPKFRKFSNFAVSDKIRGDETTRDPSAGNRYIKKSNNASQFSHFGDIMKVDKGELKLTQLRSHEDSHDGFTAVVQSDDRTCASRGSDISSNLLSGHEAAIDGAAEEVYSKPESFSENHDYGSLTGDTLEARHGDCLQRNQNGPSRYESAGQAEECVNVGVDLPLNDRCDAASADTLTSDFVMSVPVEGKCVLSDDELSGQDIDADADNADDYWVPDGYGNRISAPNFDEFNEHSMMAGEQQA